MTVHLLTEADVRAVLPIADLIDPMAEALRMFSAGEVVQPLRPVVPVSAGPGFLAVMPAYAAGVHALGTKLVTVFGRNAAAGLPSHLAMIVLFDEHTGQARALMDGRYITETRTAAASAAAARVLATPGLETGSRKPGETGSRKPGSCDGPRGSGELAILGSGVQARSHLLAFAAAFRVTGARIWSPHAAHREQFIAQMQPRVAFPLTACASAEACIGGADLVVAATSSRTPVVNSAAVRSGAHVTAVGACRPDERELEPALVARGRLFVDSREAALAEAGDVVLGIHEQAFGPDVIRAEVGHVIAGRAEGRRSAEEITIFKSLGLAVEDVVAANLAFSRAVARGLGRTIEL